MKDKSESGLSLLENIEVDVMLTQGNTTVQNILDMLIKTQHLYFEDAVLDEDGDIYCGFGVYLSYSNSIGVVYVRAFDQLDVDTKVNELLQEIAFNYQFLNSSVSYLNAGGGITLCTQSIIVIKLGMSKDNFIETLKLFIAQYRSIWTLRISEHLYEGGC
jgi:hypothetical protein